MRIAETVTFGGSGLDRHATLRREATGLKDALGAGTVLPIWRGKPLLHQDRLAWVAANHPVLNGGEGFAELRGVMTRLDPREAELVVTAKAVLHWHRSHGFCSTCGARSEMTQGGWQRTCPACGAQHFPRTDPVVIMLVTHGNSVLLGRSPGWPEGMFSLLAGFVEPGETIEAAVRREVLEETGVTCGAVSYLASQPWPFPASLMIGARTEALTRDIRLDPEELEAAVWVTREELVQSFAGRHPSIRPSRKGAIAHFILRNWLADRLD
jgi:NAD+ diphosphatase